MITDISVIQEFEKEFGKSDQMSLEQKFALMESLYEHARRLGHFSDEDLLEGLDDDIDLARKLNTHVPIPSR